MFRLDCSTGSRNIGLFTMEFIAREHAGPGSLDVFLSDSGSGRPLDQSLIRLPPVRRTPGNLDDLCSHRCMVHGRPFSFRSRRLGGPIALSRFTPHTKYTYTSLPASCNPCLTLIPQPARPFLPSMLRNIRLSHIGSGSGPFHSMMIESVWAVCRRREIALPHSLATNYRNDFVLVIGRCIVTFQHPS